MDCLKRLRALGSLLMLALAVQTASAQGVPAKVALPPGYAGSAECLDCHAKQLTNFAETAHSKTFMTHPRNDQEGLGCELCHGPGKAHAASGGDVRGGLIAYGKKQPATVAVRNAVCLTCHEKTARMLWQGSSHESRDVPCTSCHTVMQNMSERGNLKLATVRETCGTCHAKQKAAAMRSTHMPLGEAKIECTSCHNPHGSANPKLLLASSTNETCYTCHAEKRGPFLWEHAPVVDNCVNCHDPHGSSHEKMLKVSRPRLCQQCHMGTGHPQQPRRDTTLANGKIVVIAADVQFLLNRQCSNCHFNIHGSNHPSGKYFNR